MSGRKRLDLWLIARLAEELELLRDALLALLGINRPPERPPAPRSSGRQG